uniref:Rab-GAP TBC domain-containing protein n=1 Tax=Esox lucius TaxID=8010 RepID=A0AAY5KSB5_ESOLU
MLSVSTPTQITPGGEDSSESDRGSEVGVPLPATETDRFGFILGNGSTASGIRSEGPPPELVRQREAKWISIISQWDRVLLKKSSKIKEQCQKGIPASLRAKCWPLLSGATDRMRLNKDLYQTLDSRPALQSWVDIIERDLDRQFPFHEMFLSRDGHGQRGLFRVLKAFTQLRPEEGYCQAQGPVAAVLLMNMPTEEAFWCLVQISELYLPGYYSPLLEGVLFDAAMLTWVLKKMCPAAHKHMQRHEVDPLMFATDWLMCLFTRHLPFNTLLRVWDLFFCYGVRVLFQVAVVLVRRALGRVEHREECDGQMETLERLRGVKEHVLLDDDAFIAEVCSVPLSGKDLDKQTEKELEKWRKERPASTFDPRGRCHGYRTVWARAREREERNKKQREKVNMSLHINRSPSTLSLSPSVFRKRQKRGSKSDPYEGEGGCRGVSEVPEEVWEEQRDGGIFRRASETGEGPSRTQGVPPTPKDRVPFKPKGQEARTQDSDPRQELTSQRQRKNQGQTFRAPEAQDTSHSQDNVETQEILNTQSTGRANVITEHMVTETPGEEEESEEVEEAAKTRDKTLTDKHTRQDIQTHAEPKRAGDMETEKTSEILTDESAETGMATDAKQGADTNTGSLTGRHTETDTQSLTGRHTETDTRSLTGRHTETDTATDTDKEVEAGIEVQLQTGAETETCADTKSEVERPDEAEVYPEAETLGECDSTIHIDADTLAEAETDSGSQMEAVKNTEGPVNTEVGTEGPVHKEEEGPANKEEEGPVHKEEEGPVNTEVETEGPVNTEVETEGPVNQGVEGPVNQGVEGPVNQGVEGPVNQGVEGPVNQGVEGPVNKRVEGPVNKRVEGPVNKRVEGPVNQGVEGPVNTETEVPVNTETEVPVNTETEVPVNTEAEVPVNTEAEVPVNTEAEVPVNTEAEVPVNTEAEVPVNTEVETEVPVNTEVETEVPVNTEVETEVPVNTEVETEGLVNTEVGTEGPVNTEVETEGPVNTEVETEGPVNTEVETEGPVNTEVEVPVNTEVEVPVNTEVKTKGPVNKEIEEPVNKVVETEGPINNETKVLVNIKVETEGPVHKETETLANKKTEEPVNKEVERPVDTKVEGPVNKEIEKEGPINKEVEGTVNKEGDEYVTKEVDTPVNTEIEGPVKIEVEEGIEKPVESPNEILVHTEAISHIEVRDTGTEPCGTTPVTSSPEPEVEGDSPDGPGQEKTATDEPQGPVTMPPGLCQDASESEEAREDVFPLPSQEVSADIITALQPGEPLRADISHIPGNKASERGKSDSPLVEPKADSGSSVAAPADASSRRTLPGDGPWAVPAGDFRLRKSSSSRRHTRKLSAELFTDPNQSQPASNQSQPASNQSQPASNQSNASLVASGQTQATPSAPVQAAVPPESPRRVTGTTSTPPPPQAGLKPDREPPNTPRRFGLFRLLRGEQPKHDRAKVEPKVPVPHILIQDFSDGVGDGCTVGVEEEGKLSSRERRRRRREQQRREKEEEKLQKKREKELEKEEKEKKKERRKPQTRGKSFQVQPSHAPLFGISGSKTFGSKRNSTPSTEAYF